MAPKTKNAATKGKGTPIPNKPATEPILKDESIKETIVVNGVPEELQATYYVDADKYVEFHVKKTNDRLDALEAKIEELLVKRKSVSLQKVEGFNGEEIPQQEESRMKMTHEEKLVSMTNAAKILPPNMIVDGRHSRENVQALVGFLVSEEMMDEVYSKFKHEEF